MFHILSRINLWNFTSQKPYLYRVFPYNVLRFYFILKLKFKNRLWGNIRGVFLVKIQRFAVTKRAEESFYWSHLKTNPFVFKFTFSKKNNCSQYELIYKRRNIQPFIQHKLSCSYEINYTFLDACECTFQILGFAFHSRASNITWIANWLITK